MPQVLLQLIAHCESDEAGMASLAQILANDAALSAKVLRVATSPAYHRGTHAARLEQALATIGMDRVRTLLITESVYQTFNRIGTSHDIDLRAFWRHAISTGIIARAVAQKLGYAHAEEAYLGGLLHDIGRLALVAALPEEYAANFFALDDLALCAAEERTLEITHAEAGALLLERMNLDSFIADSLRYHHAVLTHLQTAHLLVRTIAIADALASPDALGEGGLRTIAGQTGISEQDLRECLCVDTQVQAIAKLLGIELAGIDAQPSRPAPAHAKPAAGDPLGHKVRDLMLATKATEGLDRYKETDACMQAIVGAAVILFDFSDALIFTALSQDRILAPVALQKDRQRLSGLRLPFDDASVAALSARTGEVHFHLPPRQASIAEQQLLRFLGADALVALRLGAASGQTAVLLGTTDAAGARHLQDRRQLLRDFGTQAGAALERVSLRANAESVESVEIADRFRLASQRVAHEVNNPLSIIKNYLGVLHRKSGGEQAIAEELAIMTEEIDRVAQIINEFATSPQPTSDTASDVGAALEYAARLFLGSGSINPGVRIGCRDAGSGVKAAVSPRTLNQILLNLIKNANEAMPDGGRIELHDHGIVHRDGRQYVMVSVSDTGPGMPAHVLSSLFAPVRSDKGGAHRGLGLSIVHELVGKAEGHIACRSGTAGTLFDILLPPAGGAGVAQTAAQTASSMQGEQ